MTPADGAVTAPDPKTATEALGATGAPWYGALPEASDDDKTFKGWVEKKDFKDPISTLKGYRELEKHVGANRVLLPGEKDDISQWEGWDKLGVPKDAKGYEGKINRPTMPEGMVYDEKMEAAYLEHAGKVRTPAHIVQQNIDFFAQQQIAQFSAAREHEAKEAADLQGLFKEWGSDKDINIDFAKRGGKFLGLSTEEIEALDKGLLGGKGVMTALMKIGRKVREGSAVDGDTNPMIGKEAALAEIERFNERIRKGETLTPDDMKRRKAAYKIAHG